MTIADKLQYLIGTKAAIKEALEDKGVEVSDTDTFRSYATKIGNISTGGSGGDTVAGLYASDIFSIDENGKLNKTTASAITCTAKDICGYGMRYAFYGSTELTSVDFPNLSTVSSNYGLDSAFGNCSNLISANFSYLTTISGSSAMQNTFENCLKLTSVNFLNLTTISGSNGLSSAFNNCQSLTYVNFPSLTRIIGTYGLLSTFNNCKNLISIEFPNLTTLSASGMNSAFNGCKELTSIDFPALTNISSSGCMSSAFNGCTGLISVSFPALTSTSFGTYTNQFNKMLRGITGCTVHFPSNLQSVIGSWSDVTAGFGGTNTTVLFDLPATA